MSTENDAYKWRRGIERAKQEARLEATIQRTILIAVATILIGYFLAVIFLIKGVLFGKNKNVRIFSALGLLALAIGTTVLVKYVRSKFMDNQLPAASEEQGLKSQSQSNHAPGTTQLARTTGESKEMVPQSDSPQSPSEARPPTVEGKSEDERPHEEVKVEYRCRFCGLHSFDKEKDGQVVCKKAPRVEGKNLNHDFVPSEDYVEPVEEMCIKCGYKTRFPEFFSRESCKSGLGHEFYKTLIAEPKMQDCDLHKDASHVCVYCGRFTSYPERFSNGECTGCLPPTQRGHHRFVTKEKYVSLAAVQCEKCGISTKIPELRADEECEEGGRHKFPVEQVSSTGQSPTSGMTENANTSVEQVNSTAPTPTVHTHKVVKITGFRNYRFGQKYPATRMTAEMRQEGSLAIKPVSISYRKFRTLELGYAINGKSLCSMKLCAEFPVDTDDNRLDNEVASIKGELERQFGFEMTESGNEISYEDDNYIVRVWYESTVKTVYKTMHVRFRKQRIANTVNIKGLYLLLEDKRLKPKY